ncbi:MAG: tryptophan synthase subunit alpha [Methanocorpusculum sp.]|nr:tryptophan synthase subunit alpha [Methanocorpusculum sp.]MDD3046917.1 tryptophan synthase subunit alpha [Methanocorpusculum sp.]MDD3912162.1 tryptophan synthase subunit alpha [Methanocorpusculum sp.]MDD4423445.1 tryptophan synthase subunit alpha [Methanocorpusculum parvum]
MPAKSGKERVLAAFVKPGFVGYTVAGDPNLSDSIEIAKALIDGGCDVLELGVPFSDPVADGGVIQSADNRAINAGITTDGVFEIVRAVRNYSDVPIVFLVYCNIVFRRGIDRFYDEAKEAGVDGMLIVDMPPEEIEPALKASERTGIAQILLVTQTTSDERLDMIVRLASGFIYLVSSLGVTGKRAEISTNAFPLLERVKARTRIPVAVGFGISEPVQAAEVVRHGADGVIVGSAIVGRIEDHLGDKERMLNELRRYVRSMKSSVDDEADKRVI